MGVSNRGLLGINEFRIVDAGILNLSVPANATYSYQYEHNLGYEPAMLIFQAEDSPTASRSFPVINFNGSGVALSHVYAIVDDTYLTVWVEQYGSPSATLIDIRYYLLRETAS